MDCQGIQDGCRITNEPRTFCVPQPSRSVGNFTSLDILYRVVLARNVYNSIGMGLLDIARMIGVPNCIADSFGYITVWARFLFRISARIRRMATIWRWFSTSWIVVPMSPLSNVLTRKRPRTCDAAASPVALLHSVSGAGIVLDCGDGKPKNFLLPLFDG